LMSNEEEKKEGDFSMLLTAFRQILSKLQKFAFSLKIIITFAIINRIR